MSRFQLALIRAVVLGGAAALAARAGWMESRSLLVAMAVVVAATVLWRLRRADRPRDNSAPASRVANAG